MPDIQKTADRLTLRPQKNDTPPADTERGEADKMRLALRPAEAARAIGISPRLLWSLMNQDLIPHLKLGRRVLYPVDALQAWLAEQAKVTNR